MIPARFAANLDWLYPERPYLDRVTAAREDGFQAIEMLQPHREDRAALRSRLDGLAVALVNAPSGDWSAGERGFAALPDRVAEFRDAMLRGIDLATSLGARRLHVLSGQAQDSPATRDTWLANLQWAAGQVPPALRLTIEPINRRDMPGYFLHRQAQAHALLDQLSDERVQLQLDLYHCRISEGESLSHLQRALQTGRLGHVQLAGVDGRHEPRAGEYDDEFETLRDSRWPGWIGLEYRPLGDTRTGLAWLQGV